MPVPNRIATRNSSTSGETSHPARIIQARSPRAITRLTPIVSQRDQRQPERAVDDQQHDQEQDTVATAARSSEVWMLAM